MPRSFAMWAVVVGFALLLLGVALMILFAATVPQAFSTLTTCIGFGLVLVAFGAQATGTILNFTVGGAAAASIVLFVVVQQYIGDGIASLKRGQIVGNFNKVADLKIIDEDPIYSRRDRNTGAIRFVLLEKKFQSSRLIVQVNTVEEGPGREYFEMVAQSDFIAKNYVHNTSNISWQFDYSARQIKDGAKVIFAEVNDINEEALGGGVRRGSLWPNIDLVPSAYAQGVNSPPTAELIKQLSSDDTAVRRIARDGLIVAGPGAVAPMMVALKASPTDYRVRLGVSYSLAGMLRKDASLRPALTAQLTDADLALLQELTSDPDPTLRFQATEFLYNLRDSRSVSPSIKEIEFKNSDASSNSALILKNIYMDLSASEQQKIESQLEPGRMSINSKTRSIIDSFTKEKAVR